jgi:hypothetical protein
MEYRDATEHERRLTRELIDEVVGGIQAAFPPEDEYPGITGLIVTALMHAAGDLLHGIEDVQVRAVVTAQFQEYLAAAAGCAATRH